MAEEQTFTQEQVDQLKQEWIEKELNPLKTQLEELKGKLPKEKTDEEKALEQKQAELWQKEVELELKTNGLADFAPFVTAKDEDDLKAKIEQLNKIVAGLKIDSSYKPDDHKQTSEYDKYEKEGNTIGMISSKLSSLFK
jgi:hypothetical protein